MAKRQTVEKGDQYTMIICFIPFVRNDYRGTYNYLIEGNKQSVEKRIKLECQQYDSIIEGTTFQLISEDYSYVIYKGWRMVPSGNLLTHLLKQ